MTRHACGGRRRRRRRRNKVLLDLDVGPSQVNTRPASTREIFSEVSQRTDLERFFDSYSKKRGNKDFLIGPALAGEERRIGVDKKNNS
jgi:hypothetical protein